MSDIHADLREIQAIGSATREQVVGVGCVPGLGSEGLVYVGASDAREGFEFARLQPRFSAVLATVSGQGRVLVGGQWRDCLAGQVYRTCAGVPHAYHVAPGGRWRLAWAVAAPSRHPSSPPDLVPGDAAGLDRAVRGLYAEQRAAADPDGLRCWAELVGLHARRLVGESARDERLDALWRAVDQELARDRSLSDLAAEAGVSPERLRQLCLRDNGRSPMKHLTWMRMQRAGHLLRTTGWRVEAVADAVGYDNAFAFSTAFRRWTGVAPVQHRAGRRPPT